MEKEKTLVIMAAGMGSRFGGLKQIEPVGPNGEYILDYSIYDAIKAGFNNVVFIIKKEHYDLFRETVGKRIENKIRVEYAFQDINNIPSGYKTPEDREKPWGTGHAVLSAKDLVKGSFAIINADDFYSNLPYQLISKFFDTNESDNTFLIPPYMVGKTLAATGSVKRGVCEIEDGFLTNLIESAVERSDSGEIIASPLDGRTPFPVDEKSPVSMNIWGFTPKLFELLEVGFITFFEQNKDDLSKCEYLLPDAIESQIKNGNITVKALAHDGHWYGITYKEDKDELVKKIQECINHGDYPESLWK